MYLNFELAPELNVYMIFTCFICVHKIVIKDSMLAPNMSVQFKCKFSEFENGLNVSL